MVKRLQIKVTLSWCLTSFLFLSSTSCVSELDLELRRALRDKDVARVGALIKQGANPNSRYRDGGRPLYSACGIGDIDLVKILVESGADVSAKVSSGTCLMLCALEGKTEIARLLLENGAKVNQTNRARVTALFPACMNGHLEMVKLLVSYGANVNQVDVDGRTPLFNAVWSDAACVKFLIDHGAQINVINRWGRSPLFHLCGTPGPSERANEIGKILIENGARLDLRDREFSIYSLAKLHGHEGILKMLEERGVRE